MSFYGKEPETPPATTPRQRKFHYTDDRGNQAHIRAESVYFHDSGHVSFWDDRDTEHQGTLILAIRAFEVWEDENE